VDSEQKINDSHPKQQDIANMQFTSETILPGDFIGKTGQGICKFQSLDKLTANSSLDEILFIARQKQASDVHISVGVPLLFKIFGILEAQTEELMSEEYVCKLISSILNPEQSAKFYNKGDFELIHVIEGLGRFRVTIAKKTPGYDITIRLIPRQLYSFEDSGMPESCREFTKWSQGMVLITGPIGCGKTTTLAVLCEMINQTRKAHIITIENPIEIVFTSQKCQITQREIDLHTLSQKNALKAALRQDPDIILISELRDLATIQLTVTAAETGHLVLGTMNTNDAPQTILRIINSFPAEDRFLIQNMLSESLRGIICEQLVPKKNGGGVVPIYEVLVVNSAVSNLIRKGSGDQIMRVISTGETEGMMSFDLSLMKLYQKQTISWEEAYARCVNKKEFEKVKYKK